MRQFTLNTKGQLVDSHGRVYPADSVLAKLCLFDDLIRAVEYYQQYCENDLPPMVGLDIANTLTAAKLLKNKIQSSQQCICQCWIANTILPK